MTGRQASAIRGAAESSYGEPARGRCDRTLASLTPEEFAKLLAAIQAYEGWKEGKIVAVTAT